MATAPASLRNCRRSAVEHVVTQRVSEECQATPSLAYASGYLKIRVFVDNDSMNSDDPIAFFLTWVTYGTWLPGDSRGWVEYRHGWQIPSPPLEADCEARMSDDAVRLPPEQRQAVENQIREPCQRRGGQLHAANCRSNHVHAVVSAGETPPKKRRIDLKAYATRCLKSFDRVRENWWAERGSIRWIYNDDEWEAAVTYVVDGQDRKPEA